jgi:diguanylate cyclase (GGDEF)-like protein
MTPPTCHVLLVEDMPLLAKITEQMLRKSRAGRYSLVHRPTLAAALGELERREFDVVLLDLNLPDSRELSTLTAVLEAAPDMPVVVLTATQSPEIGHRAIQLGAQDFLIKGDFNFPTLDRAISYGIERHRLQRTLAQLAVLDELTGLYNRRGLHTLFPDVMQRVRRVRGRGYLCYFDLDHFKRINDEFGHPRGDEALVDFAGALRAAYRKGTILARLGGDEFVALGMERGAGQAERSRQALPGVLAGLARTKAHPLPIAASCGIAHFDADGAPSFEELTALADAALYQDKESRRAEREPAAGVWQDAGASA